MKRLTLLFASLLLCWASPAQVTLVIQTLPEYTPEDEVIYLAGSINGWNPGDPAFALEKNDENLWSITTDPVAEGTVMEYKFTRGSWETVEKGPQGEEIANREFTFGNGETVIVTIHNWADFTGPGDSTAAWNVSILDDDFYMPQLERYRRIWLYLPPDYHETDNRYPVLYMHDGQNLFESLTSFAGEWEVDETLNALADSGYRVPIVVGIENGGIYRFEELTPWPDPIYGGGKGNSYLAFITETLKPYVDEHYRTLPGRDHTALLGSSLGGLISAYGALKYQDVFSKSAPFSPAYWVNRDSIWDYLRRTGKQQDIMFYQNAGEQEGDLVNMMFQMDDSLTALGFDQVLSKEIPGGGHNEATWRDDFGIAYLWLFANYATHIPDHRRYRKATIVPNPVLEQLTLTQLPVSREVAVSVYDMAGNMVAVRTTSAHQLDVTGLPPGVYTMRFSLDGIAYEARFIKQ